jgi:hypothetical protein
LLLLSEIARLAVYAAGRVEFFFIPIAIDAAGAIRSLSVLLRLNALQIKNLRHCLSPFYLVGAHSPCQTRLRVELIFPNSNTVVATGGSNAAGRYKRSVITVAIDAAGTDGRLVLLLSMYPSKVKNFRHLTISFSGRGLQAYRQIL